MKKFITLFLFSLQGCQTPFFTNDVPEEGCSIPIEAPLIIETPTIPPEAFSVPVEQAQAYNLFLRGAKYAELDKQQRKIACKQLKLDFKTQEDWKTAWLLAYAVNYNFTCISLNRSIELLNIIKNDPDTIPQLHWINNNQINHLKILQKSVTAKANLAIKLKKSEDELKQESSKIEELKAIESDINKKLDNAEMQLEEESGKIEALKVIESDMNKKLDE